MSSIDYGLSLADLRSFGELDNTYYKCWSRPAPEPWNTLLAPIFSPPLYLDQPPSPTDTCASSASSSSPPPRTTHVVCNAPLVAPIPLPYHSPTFLQFELPDIDEDLSHPPYTSRAGVLKRKRAEDDAARPQKRRSTTAAAHLGNVHTTGGPRTRNSRALHQLRR